MQTLKAAVAGAAVLAMAGIAVDAGVAGAAAAPTKGGTAHFVLQDDTDFTDPALDYYQIGWDMEYATCVKLLNYPDTEGAKGSTITPEAAKSLPTVSAGGKTYTFTVPPHQFQFSPPSNQFVTAKTFQFVINRLANPKMSSPALPFIADIVGVDAVQAGKSSKVSGVTVSGNKLIIKLTKAHPDFLSRVAMPFFCALPTNTPLDPNGVNTPSAAGPYYISQRTLKKQIVLTRNPNYHPASWGMGKRPANLDKMIFQVGVAPDAALLEIKNGQADWGVDEVYPAEYGQLWAQYGPTSALGKKGKQQFFVSPILGVEYLAMNTSRGVFLNNTKLRQAVNFAIDRPTILRGAGLYAGKVSDQVLPPGINGFKDINAYPLNGPNVNEAKKRAAGTNAEVTMYTSNRPSATARAPIYIQNLSQIGLKVNVQQFARATQIDKEGTKGEPFDLTTEGWIADYADPFDFINVLLSGDSIQDQHNNNVAYFNVPKVNAAETAASLVVDPKKRGLAYQNLDQQITTQYAPWAVIDNIADRDFFSARMGGQLFHPVYSIDLATMFIRK